MSAQTLDADERDRVLAAAIEHANVPRAALRVARICAKSPSNALFVTLRENIFFQNSPPHFSSLGLRCDFRSERATSIFVS
jgi:hypothetical protein